MSSGYPTRNDDIGAVADTGVTDPTASATLIALAKGDKTLLGAATETPPASDTASSGLNGRLQRIAQRLTALIALLPTSLGVKAGAASLPVVLASDQAALLVSASTLPLPTGAATEATLVTLAGKIPPPGQAFGSESLPVVLPQSQVDTIALRTPAQGAALSSASMPVVLATDDAQIGVKTSAAALGAGGSGLIGWLSEIANACKSWFAALTATAYSDTNRLPIDERDGFAFTGNATAAGVLGSAVDTTGYKSISVQVTSAGTSCTLTYETSDDATTWYATSGMLVGAVTSVNASSAVASTSTALAMLNFPARGRWFRVRCSTYGSGTVSIAGTLQAAPAMNVVGVAGAVQLTSNSSVVGAAAHGAAVSGAPNRVGGKAVTANVTPVTTGQTADLITTTQGALVVRHYSIPEAEWHYAAPASGVVNTTAAVTFVAAAGAGLRNYITSIDITAEALTNATEVVIRDGAGGGVLWRSKIGTAGWPNGRQLTFDDPLKSSVNTLLEFATLTASGAGAVYPNAHGYFGS